MSEAVRTPVHAAPAAKTQDGNRSSLRLQRQCACGSRSSSAGGECEGCRRKRTTGLQAKLQIGSSTDRLELDADRIAEQVLGMPGARVSGAAAGHVDAPPRIQRATAAMPDVALADAPPIVDDVLRSPGRPMDATTRSYFEPRFGHDFGRVRIHADGRAARSAEAIGALAYTVGNDVVFASGAYAPASTAGQRLLAHELTHVVQQSGISGDAQPGLVLRHPADKSKCLGDPDWKRIDASPQEIYAPANDAIEKAYKDSHAGHAILTGSQFESGGKPGASGTRLPKGAPDKGACDKLLDKFQGVSRQLAPDIMDCSDRVFYEIKTNQFAGKGAEQILSYYKLANELSAQAGEKPWNIDFATWYPPHVLMLEPTRRVCTEGTDYDRTQRPGLIIYEVQDHKDRKQKKQEEEKEKQEQEKQAKEKQAANALRQAKLRKVKEFVDQLQREVETAEGENRMQLNLINDPSYSGFWGYWTNQLFSKQPPLTMIWDGAFGALSAARIQLKAGNAELALQRFVEARIAYLQAQKVYQGWKESLPGAGEKMQTAIVVSAVVALVAFVAPTVVARAASSVSGGAGTAANLAVAENAVAQAGVRIAAGEAQIGAIEATIAEAEIVSSAELEAEMYVLKLMHF
jgi:hypothetical protein